MIKLIQNDKMKLTQIINEGEEKRTLSNEVKKHFLEIVSTYNKYQEMMDRKSDLTQVAETLGGITEAARTLAIYEGDNWFDKHTVKRNMSELDKLGKEFDKVAGEANSLDQRMAGLYEDMGHILSRYYKMGEITEDQMKSRLGIREVKINTLNESFSPEEIERLKDATKKFGRIVGLSKLIDKMGYHTEFVMIDTIPMHLRIKKNKNDKDTFIIVNKKYVDKPDWVVGDIAGGLDENVINTLLSLNEVYTKSKKQDCGCGCGGVTEGGCGDSVVEQAVLVSKRTVSGNIVTHIKEENELNETEHALYEFGKKIETLMEKNCPTDAGKWSASKAAAKSKFDVYPSAYANGWAAKNYKGKGGTWKKC